MLEQLFQPLPFAQVMATLMLAILFLQSGLDKVLDFGGNLGWLSGHFAKTPLRGAVLPVGGIKEKVLAAHRAGITRVILPARNERDLVDIPESVRDEMAFVFAEDMHEVIEAALEAPELHDDDLMAGVVAPIAAAPPES